MKKMFVVSLVLAAGFAMGCSKKNAQTTPTNTGGTQTEMKNDGTGGATYGGDKTGGGDAPADPCAAPAPK